MYIRFFSYYLPLEKNVYSGFVLTIISPWKRMLYGDKVW